jgi:colicin import membrane protein
MRQGQTYHKRRDGLIAVFIFHAALLAVLYYSGLSVPLPLPAEEGILLNFGLTEIGSGSAEPIAAQPVSNEVNQRPTMPSNPAPSTPANPTANESLTQDFEEAPALPPKKKEAIEPPKKEPKQTATTSTTDIESKKEAEEKPVPKVNTRALYPGKKDNGSDQNQGVGEDDGNQGEKDGEPDINNYQSGAQVGGGSGFSLSGRSLVGALPKPDYNTQVEGVVVVEIQVDRNGNVVSARAGVKGSTINDSDLCQEAEEAARGAKFNRKPDAIYTQTGTITYVFDLQ